MPDLRISALPATVTINNSDVFPLVHGGVTSKVTYANLLADIVANIPSTSGWSLTGNATGNDTSFIGTTDNQTWLFKSNNTTYGTLGKTGIWSIGTISPIVGTRLSVNGLGTTSSTFALQVHNSSGTNNSFTIMDNGMVGINTASQGSKLQINDDSGGSANQSLLSLYSPNNGQQFRWYFNGTIMVNQYYGIEVYNTYSSGNTLWKVDPTAQPGMTLLAATDNTAGNTIFQAYGSDMATVGRFQIMASGNVSIGTNGTPSAKLDVFGVGSSSATYSFKTWNITPILTFGIRNDGRIETITAIDTTAGDSATLNVPAGRFRKDTSGTTFTLTNSLINANSIILLQYASDPGITGFDNIVVAGSGSAVITFTTSGVPAAPTSNTDINFWVIN